MSAPGASVSAASPLALRPAEQADADALALVGAATFLESYAHLLPASDILAHVARQHAPAVYRKYLEDPACRCWIAEHLPGRAPVGYLVATPPDLPLPDIDLALDWEIRRIYLLHRFQGLRLGRQLMEAALDAARAMGRRRVLLGVYSRNEAALRFYDRLGFTRVGTRSFRVGHNDYHDYILGRAP
ncbi:MAG: GNAT family N-acetyltransferase [Pseudomonadota bacterium]|jgi:ribosomal protein S18 acetylase RimI-like enzyme|nr:MAG: GNAT family N-acetyltransferase [Pseudomonadota bacterium]